MVLILFASCKKDKIPNITDNNNGTETVPCESFNWQDPAITLNSVYGDTIFLEPCFSPFTDDEFVYVRRISGGLHELVKYKISTEEEQILCNINETGGVGISQPDWGKQGRIIFSVGTGSSGIGYIINNDGTGLNQFLPPDVNFIKPKFNGNGTQIHAIGAGIPNTTVAMFPIYNLEGNIVDSLRFMGYNDGTIGIGGQSFFDGEIKEGLFGYRDNSKTPEELGLGFITSDSTFQPVTTTNTPEGYQLTDIDKYQNYIYYVLYGKGFYQYNELTGTTKLLQEMCDTRKILNISVSQITGNILIEEHHNSKLSEFGGVLIQPNIYLLNPNTMEKTPILVKK